MCLYLFLHSYCSFCISGSSPFYESVSWEMQTPGQDRQHLPEPLLIRSTGFHMLEGTLGCMHVCPALDSPCSITRRLANVMKHRDSFYLIPLTSEAIPRSRVFLTPSPVPSTAVHRDLWRRGPDPNSPLSSARPAFLQLSAPSETSGATSL